MRRRSIRWSKIEPIARYFIFVGGTLAALLLIADWCPPAPPATFSHQLVIDRSIILIKSALKCGIDCPGHQPADHNTSDPRGASDGAVGLATA
jgi:hypothetical protein